ncbi:MAG: DNA alkylation response protein [Gammaproteobacteria bacterium]|nr:DNA alkylation response protein [Gammaproteobacteria bacterium]
MAVSEALPGGAIAPDTKGQNFFSDDRALAEIASLYLDDQVLRAITPYLEELGYRVANDLDELAMAANRHPPVLHQRDKYGTDRQWIEYHPSYRALEQAAFGDYGIHALSHRPVIEELGKPLPTLAKHLYTFLFNQTEFGLGCPINVTDSAAHVISKFGSPDLKRKYLPRMLAMDMKELWQGAQFITEQEGGSDVGRTSTTASRRDGEWYLTGDKWFCSNADADIAMILARPTGAQEGTRGLALFAMPRVLDDGSVNRIRIVRLKDKFGTRSMASGELRLEGALAYPVGQLGSGFKQMAEMINRSRLSNGVKSAALMRRALHDAFTVAHHRSAFGKPLIELPLARRQLLKIQLSAEQALSMWAFAAAQLQLAESNDSGANAARSVARLATPVLKLRSTRDARAVCGDAMEFRGGCGYIEEYVNPRLVRDAYLGSIWEGTTNIVAIDAVRRAIGKDRCLEAYVATLHERLDTCDAAVPVHVQDLRQWLDRVGETAQRVADENDESRFRVIATALYHVSSAVLLAWEGLQIASLSGDASRLLWSKLVLEHKLNRPGYLDPIQRQHEIHDALLRQTSLGLNVAKQYLQISANP